MKTRITHSARSTYSSCAKKYHYRYIRKIAKKTTDSNLYFGDQVHQWLEHRFKGMTTGCHTEPGNNPLSHFVADPGVKAICDGYALQRPLERVMERDNWRILAVEHEFEVPLTNPDTGRPSASYFFSGKIDVILEKKWSDERAIVDHKTCSRLTGDYIEAAGHGAQLYLYAIALMSGKNTWKVPPRVTTLFVNVLEKCTLKGKKSETEDEFNDRKVEWHQDPDHYHVLEFAYNPAFAEEVKKDLWADTKRLIESRRTDLYPRNTGNCFNYHRRCPYFEHCILGNGDADQLIGSVYEIREPFEELDVGGAK